MFRAILVSFVVLALSQFLISILSARSLNATIHRMVCRVMIHGQAIINEISDTCNVNTPIFFDKIGAYDVLCGRNKVAFNNVGNRRFRTLVSNSLHEYVHVSNRRKEKSQVVRNIIATTIKSGGFFLQEKNGVLIELSDREAQVKVGHAIRDMVISKARTHSDEFSASLGSSSKVKGFRTITLTTAQNHHIASHSSLASSEGLESGFCDFNSYEPIPLNAIVSESCDNCINRALQIFSTDDNKALQILSTDDNNIVHRAAPNFHVFGLEELVEVEFENLEETFSPEMIDVLLELFTE